MSGTLYIVATPIGNLGDLTPRAAETFAKADFIAAEDTRVTLKLLNHLGLKKPMVSYYEHNLKERGGYILDRIEAGESCALCSDAGMPAVSDPGEVIVRDAHARGIPVVRRCAFPGSRRVGLCSKVFCLPTAVRKRSGWPHCKTRSAP